MNEMSKMGHNEATARLGLLAEDARHALECVQSGETTAIEGWLAYGAALNDARELFPADREFGEWIRSAMLADRIHDHERAAAMWAAKWPEQFAEAKAAGNARTVRGIHAKWQEIKDAREAELERHKAEMARKEAQAAQEARAAAQAEHDKAENEAQAKAARQRADEAERQQAEAQSRADEADAAAVRAQEQADQRAEQKRQRDDLREGMIAALDAPKPSNSRRNPDKVSDPNYDRVVMLSGLCCRIAEMETFIEEIAEWDEIPVTSERLPKEVAQAISVLQKFMEAKTND